MIMDKLDKEQIPPKIDPKLRFNAMNSITEVNRDVLWMDSFTLVVKRGKSGYGFTVCSSSPVRIGRVEDGSTSYEAGLQKDDYIVRINGQNVSRSMADSVAKIVRHSDKQIIMDIHRPASTSTLKPRRKPLAQISGPAPQNEAEQCQVISSGELQHVLYNQESCRENGIDVGRPCTDSRMTSALPQLTLSFQELNDQEQERQRAIQKLGKLEKDFLTVMRCGMLRYYRPLRNGIISNVDHGTLFQNIDRVVATSEYHLEQFMENSVAYSDVTDPRERFIDSVGSLLLPKINMMYECYEVYCSGLRDAVRLLMTLRESDCFEKFLKNPSLESGQPSISAFIQKPLEHLKEILLVLQEVLTLTSKHHHDYDCLCEVVYGLRNCCNTINENHTRRSRSTQSLTSYSSSQSQVSAHSAQSAVSIASIDSEVLDIQCRLSFPKDMMAFQLATATRHMIYSSELLYFEMGSVCTKVMVVLMSDLLLITSPRPDDSLSVLDEPLLLHEITQADFICSHPAEFTLTVRSLNSGYEPRMYVFHAATIEQKCTWKNILEQRIVVCRSQREQMLRVSETVI